MSKLSYKKKKSFPVKIYGLPKEKKYPMPDLAHLKAAMTYFEKEKNEKNKEILVKNIIRRYKELGADFTVSEDNDLFYHVPTNMRDSNTSQKKKKKKAMNEAVSLLVKNDVLTHEMEVAVLNYIHESTDDLYDADYDDMNIDDDQDYDYNWNDSEANEDNDSDTDELEPEDPNSTDEEFDDDMYLPDDDAYEELDPSSDDEIDPEDSEMYDYVNSLDINAYADNMTDQDIDNLISDITDDKAAELDPIKRQDLEDRLEPLSESTLQAKQIANILIESTLQIYNGEEPSYTLVYKDFDFNPISESTYKESALGGMLKESTKLNESTFNPEFTKYSDTKPTDDHIEFVYRLNEFYNGYIEGRRNDNDHKIISEWKEKVFQNYDRLYECNSLSDIAQCKQNLFDLRWDWNNSPYAQQIDSLVETTNNMYGSLGIDLESIFSTSDLVM